MVLKKKKQKKLFFFLAGSDHSIKLHSLQTERAERPGSKRGGDLMVEGSFCEGKAAQLRASRLKDNDYRELEEAGWNSALLPRHVCMVT
jgi:hypothetical protein